MHWYALILEAILAVALVFTWRWYRKRRLLERAFFLRGYVYVEVYTSNGCVRGFATQSTVREVNSPVRPKFLRLETYATRESITLNTETIEWVRQVRPKLKQQRRT